MDLGDLTGLISRFVHILSAIALLGGVLFARQVLSTAGQSDLVVRYAGVFRAAVGGLLATGLYNLLTKSGLPKGYHMIFGIKFLLALHVFAIAILLGNAGVEEAKRRRWLTGTMISGIAIVALSAYLRWLTTAATR